MGQVTFIHRRDYFTPLASNLKASRPRDDIYSVYIHDTHTYTHLQFLFPHYSHEVWHRLWWGSVFKPALVLFVHITELCIHLQVLRHIMSFHNWYPPVWKEEEHLQDYFESPEATGWDNCCTILWPDQQPKITVRSHGVETDNATQSECGGRAHFLHGRPDTGRGRVRKICDCFLGYLISMLHSYTWSVALHIN